jgi:hypothetical protein
MRDFVAVHEEPRLELSSLHLKPRLLGRKNCEKPLAYSDSALAPFHPHPILVKRHTD